MCALGLLLFRELEKEAFFLFFFEAVTSEFKCLAACDWAR